VAGIRVTLSSVQSVGLLDASFRSRLLAGESVLGGVPNIRVQISVSESIVNDTPNMRAEISVVEAGVGSSLPSGYPHIRVGPTVVESLIAILETDVSDAVFPSVVGLAFDVHKKPIFNNKIATHVSGEETATSYYQNPKWEYSLTYDYLPDLPVSVGETDLHTILGFFLNRHGRFDSFLYSDPDDNTVVEGYQKSFDGTSVEFYMVRGIGGFYEPIGQRNIDVTLSVWLALDETFNVPAVGPYTHAVVHAAAYHQTDSVIIGGVAATKVTGAPAAGQYSVTAGVYTFNAANNGAAVDVRYRYLVDPSAYTVVLPNIVQFGSSPPNGQTAYASFGYYFRCRFIDDMQDYNKFANKLWELQELGFRSIPSQ
jgi:hypothetical protein